MYLSLFCISRMMHITRILHIYICVSAVKNILKFLKELKALKFQKFSKVEPFGRGVLNWHVRVCV